MEHRLIRGGEQYLPFARSCVTKLKKLGLSYAIQSFEIDGVSIRVSIEPNHEYIRIDGNPTMYLESGQLKSILPGLENPDRLKPAPWHFLDIPTTDPFLGKVATSFGKVGKQANSPLLTEGMDSIAIGYPQVYPPEGSTPEAAAASAAKNAENQAKYEEATVLKKTICGYFPASVFSGKMRRFIQALMGAAETTDIVPGLGIEILGDEIILTYSDSASTMRLGYWTNNTPGLFTSDDYRYWVIRITGGPVYTATAYKVSVPSSGSMRTTLKDPAVSAETKAKIESYLLAGGRIQVSNPVVIGTFTGGEGNSMAYGWKFNMDGSAASVITHKQVGIGDHDIRWEARTTTVNFTLYTDPVTGDESFSLEASVTYHGAWTDDFGSNYLFKPETDEPGAPSSLFSVGINTLGVMPAFSFSSVPVYGYYKSDVWTPVTLSRNVLTGPFPVYIQSEEGLVYDSSIDMSVFGRYQYGQRLATEGWSAKNSTVYEGNTTSIALDGFSFTGYARLGTHTHMVETVTPDRIEGVIVTAPARAIGGASYTAGLPSPPGYSAVAAASSAGEFSYGNSTAPIRSTREYNQWVYTGWDRYAWVLVIPSSDCEAAYISTHIYAEADNSGTQHVTYSYPNNTVMEAAYGRRYAIDGSYIVVRYEFTPWCSALAPGWYGDDTKTANIEDTTPEPTSTTDVFCFNTVIAGTQGTPGGSYYTLFNVEKTYPYYDRGMYTFTSSGGRYVMSEGLKLPSTAQFDQRFVGWA